MLFNIDYFYLHQNVHINVCNVSKINKILLLYNIKLFILIKFSVEIMPWFFQSKFY